MTEKNTSQRGIDFLEQYHIKLDYQNDDGSWVEGYEFYVGVPSKNEFDEKNNTDRALELAKKHFKVCKNIRLIKTEI